MVVGRSFFLRSRGTRERILIWFRRREKSRFFGLQIGRPCRFLQGLWASFSCPSVTSCLLFFVASFVVFDFLGVSLKLNWFLTLIAFDKKDNAVWSESFWSGENKLHHRKARVYETISSRSLVSRSFYSGPSVACLVRM